MTHSDTAQPTSLPLSSAQEHHDDNGFSLIELIVVIGILGIIVAIALVFFGNAQDNARQAAVEASAGRALTAVQEETLQGGTVFDDTLASVITDENIELTAPNNYFVPGDPDTVCVQASWIGTDNVATAGAGCADASLPPEDNNEGSDDGGIMRTRWEVDEQRADGLTVTLPVEGAVSGTVDWGDGETTELSASNRSHTYSEPGVYEIEVAGRFNTWDGTRESLEGLTHVLTWEEEVGVVSAHNMFRGATDLVGFESGLPSNITDVSHMFWGATAFNADISHWEFGNVVNATSMFREAESFNADISEWDVSGVRNFSSMFAWTGFDQNISDWDTSNAYSTSNMFSGNRVFNQNLNEWDMSGVRFARGMFNATDSFNQPLNNWDTSSFEDTEAMFRNAILFDQPLNNWDMSNVEDTSRMFMASDSFNQDLSDWDMSSVKTTNLMFNSADAFNGDISTWNTENLEDMSEMFWNAESFNQDISGWNVSNVGDMTGVFRGASSFSHDLGHNADGGGWNTSGAYTMESMFRGASSFNYDLRGWNVNNVTNHYDFNGGTSALADDNIPASFR